jgi:hypothetical protein
MPTQQKTTYRSATSRQMRTRICFDSNLAYLDHSLPPLGLFLQIKLNFLSLSQIPLLRHRERYSKRSWSKIQKLPLFSINKHSPHKRPTFDKKRHEEDFDKTKTTLLFSKFSSGSWSISCLIHFLLWPYFIPLWHQAPKQDQSWPLNPIASPKSSSKNKRQ